ncbi:hypothetical protein T4D_2835 [Trichinella pseudospiralis]|uniref:Uncharacterized protein n=1 Tax=Trichinella pseudospiralis TaxID=6337 RepID=A0A0V1FJ44_TRIPS|nr:hypothetical protein T4D_2835 [Trichinella pseudospiralis]
MHGSRQMYTFCGGRRSSFTCNGPAKFNPTWLNGNDGVTISSGRWLIIGQTGQTTCLSADDANSDASLDCLPALNHPEATPQGCQVLVHSVQRAILIHELVARWAQRPDRCVGGERDDGGIRAAISLTVSLPLAKSPPCPRLETKPQEDPQFEGMVSALRRSSEPETPPLESLSSPDFQRFAIPAKITWL